VRGRRGRAALCVIASLWAVTTLTAQSTPPPLPAPGRLIHLGGWRLHLHCSGERAAAQPLVVLEAGAGDFSVDWSLVQPSVARFARVCSYDRAGTGWSDLGPRPRTMQQIVWELHELLARAGERAPFLLVGHSYGGALVRMFQREYASDVAGLVLVDAQSDDPLRLLPGGKVGRSSDLATGAPIPPVKTAGPLRESEVPARIIAMIEPQLRQMVPHANDPPRDLLPPHAQRMRSWTLGQLKHALSNDDPVEAEELGLLRADRARSPHPLGDLPLIVLSRGRSEDDAAGEEGHRAEQAQLVALSRIGRQVVAERSGHHIPLQEPELVVSAIRDEMAARARP
jgi:pimeloyl-ACP methyl ester carboxylesterase